MRQLLIIFLLFNSIFAFNSCCKNKASAYFSISKNPALIGDTIIFKSCSSSEDGIIPSVRSWDFGDGSKLYSNNGVGVSDSVTHIYEASGVFNVTLNVGGAECGDIISKDITIIQ